MDSHHSPPPQGQQGRIGSNSQNRAQPSQRNLSVAQGQACQRCRQQKLRCLREFPRCTRCQRATAVCTYPSPPDRKLLAAQRVRKSRFRPLQESRSPAVLSDQVYQVYQSPNRPRPLRETSSPPREEFQDEIHANSFLHHRPWKPPKSPSDSPPRTSGFSKSIPVPSPEVARLLIEMYFTRVYNATLLFHKATFLSDYAANKLPDFVTLAMFASASIFLPPPAKDSFIGEHETELGISALSASDFGDYAQRWAKEATRQVMMRATELDLHNIQACQVLSLYWFSKNATNHAHILTHLAYTSCRLMGFHVPKLETAGGDALSDESERRCLWSCWMTACISQENASFKNDSWSEVVGLPFPSSEVSFADGRPESTEAFDSAGRVTPFKGSNRTGQTSIMGEFVKLFGLWWQIQRFVRSYQDLDLNKSSERLREFLALDRRLESISENLPADFKYHSPSSFTSPKLDPYTLFSLQSLYRLCACALHSSLVPLFSSTSSDPEISKKLVRMCAKEAVKHSVISLDMAVAFLSIRPDKSRLSSMTGYAMFVASAVQIRSLSAQGKLKTHAGYLKAAVSILKELNQYWVPLRGLWTKLWVVSSSAGLDINSFSIARNPQRASTGIHTDIEQILSPEAVSENGPGADLYTYIERREHKVASQTSSPASTAPTGQGLVSPIEGSNVALESYIHQERVATAARASSGTGELGEAPSLSVSLPFAPSQLGASDNLPSQQPQHGEHEQNLSTTIGQTASPVEMMPLNLAGDHPNMQLFEAPTTPQTMPLEQSGIFRTMMGSFDNMDGMMGIDMDLNNDDDDFWWTRSWGSVRIL